jgi:hypothetical protein
MQESDEQRVYREERTDELIRERAAAALGLGGRPRAVAAPGHAPHVDQWDGIVPAAS